MKTYLLALALASTWMSGCMPFWVHDAKSETIMVHLPHLYINEQKIQLPEILFKKDKFLELFMPINC